MGNSNKNCVTSEYSDKKEEYFERKDEKEKRKACTCEES